MARFEIRTPAPGFKGESAGVMFTDGVAVVSSDTQAGINALAYFRQAGYGVLALDGVEASEVLQRGNESPLEESARLDREIAELESRRDIEAKRKQRDDLYREVYGDAAADAREDATGPVPAAINPGVATPTQDDVEQADERQGEGASSELLAPPANNASADEWRAWAVASGRATQDEASEKSRTELINTLGADYDRDRAEQLKGGASA